MPTQANLSITHHFASLTDPRVDRTKAHKLLDILTIAICAMILPGISGAFILVLLGQYHYVLEAVVNRDWLTLALVAAGCAVGLLAFARVLKWLFSRYHDLTVAALIGLMIGSLRKIWPWKLTLQSEVEADGSIVPLVQQNILPATLNGELLLVLGLALLGLLLVAGVEWLAGAACWPSTSSGR